MAIVYQNRWENTEIVTAGNVVKEMTTYAFADGLIGTNFDASYLWDVLANLGYEPWQNYPGMNLEYLRLATVNVRSAGPRQGTAIMKWVNPDLVTYSGGAGIVTTETDQNIDGRSIILSWVEEDGTVHAGEHQGGVYQYLEPQSSITASKIYGMPDYGGDNPPGYYANRYVGKVNLGTWQGAPEGEWLCQNMSFDTSEFGEVAFRASFEFRRQPGGWDPTAIWINPETGRPPINLRDGGYNINTVVFDPNNSATWYGRGRIKRYAKEDFDSL